MRVLPARVDSQFLRRALPGSQAIYPYSHLPPSCLYITFTFTSRITFITFTKYVSPAYLERVTEQVGIMEFSVNWGEEYCSYSAFRFKFRLR